MARPPKPKLNLVHSGSRRAATRPDDLRLPVGAPQPPDHLRPDAVAVWSEIVTGLAGAGVLSAVDRVALEIVSVAAGEMIEADRALSVPLDSDSADAMRHVRQQAYRRWLGVAPRFGLTPADRARVGVHGEKQESTKARFFACGVG